MIKQKIKGIAQAKYINQMKLARLSDSGFTTIQRVFDNPTYVPNFPLLERIAKALDVPTMELIEEVPDESTKK